MDKDWPFHSFLLEDVISHGLIILQFDQFNHKGKLLFFKFSLIKYFIISAVLLSYY
jgi:hypothetical protein